MDKQAGICFCNVLRGIEIMDKGQYTIEREYLGETTIKEVIARIIQKHNDGNRGDREVNCERTVEESLDL